jgi:ankyrin repeat protein
VTSSETFIAAAIWHGGLDRAEALLRADPAIARSSIFAAAVLGDEPAVAQFLAADPAAATAAAGPYDTTALVYLCFSNYLRLDPARGPAFLRIAAQLLDAGADPNAGFTSSGEPPEFESAIYGAAGVAHHAALTRLLLDRGADPNDNETAYHAAETYDNGAMRVLVESGKLAEAGLSTLLLRKADWHDYEGIKWLLARGIDPNRPTQWGKTALHNALLSDNDIRIVELLLDHGADPLAIATRPSAARPWADRARRCRWPPGAAAATRWQRSPFAASRSSCTAWSGSSPHAPATTRSPRAPSPAPIRRR